MEEANTRLNEAEEREVRQVLESYLEALKGKDYEAAGRHLDRASFLEQVEPMMKSIAPDSAAIPRTMRMVFGVSTRDSLDARPMPQLFASLVRYLETSNPGAMSLFSKAEFKVIGSRKLKDTVHIAYRLTLPAESKDQTPFTHVTAEQLRKIGDRWAILFKLDR